MTIQSISAYEILASGGFPTIETVVTLENGIKGRASVPYGASAGSHEAAVLTDGDPSRYLGQGMLQSVKNVNEVIAPALVGKDASDQRTIDSIMLELDGTANKSNLGGNSILAVSVAVARAAAAANNLELFEHLANVFNTNPDFARLPQPMAVVIEGGKHADQTTDFQEYCISTVGASAPTESIRKVMESYHQLKKILKAQNFSVNVGNEGAFAPSGIPSNEAPFTFIMEAIRTAGYQPGQDLAISIDPAASEFFQDGSYHLKLENRQLSSEEMIGYYQQLLEKYPFVSIEDPLHEDDWENWPKMKQVTDANRVVLIGDDLTVTNSERLQRAIEAKAISAILIKLNQIGTITETIETCLLAKSHGLMTVPSHRGGGESNDTAMVDLAVAVDAAYIKVGPTRGERVSKYNRLMEIERILRNR